MPANETPSGRNDAISRIRLTLIEKKMTQAELADAADCHEKTIQNLLAGRTVRDQTLFDVCMVLGLDFDEIKLAWSGGPPPGHPPRDEPGQAGATTEIAPVYMGAYTRAAVDHYIGQYLTIRPAFTAVPLAMACSSPAAFITNSLRRYPVSSGSFTTTNSLLFLQQRLERDR